MASTKKHAGQQYLLSVANKSINWYKIFGKVRHYLGKLDSYTLQNPAIQFLVYTQEKSLHRSASIFHNNKNLKTILKEWKIIVSSNNRILQSSKWNQPHVSTMTWMNLTNLMGMKQSNSRGLQTV